MRRKRLLRRLQISQIWVGALLIELLAAIGLPPDSCQEVVMQSQHGDTAPPRHRARLNLLQIPVCIQLDQLSLSDHEISRYNSVIENSWEVAASHI